MYLPHLKQQQNHCSAFMYTCIKSFSHTWYIIKRALYSQFCSDCHHFYHHFPPPSPPPLTAHPLYPSALPPRDPSSPPLHHPTLHPISSSTGMVRGGSGEWVTGEDQSEDEELIDRSLPSCLEYPAPLAVSVFSTNPVRPHWNMKSITMTLLPSFPPSLLPSLPPSLSPSLPPSLRPSLPPSLSCTGMFIWISLHKVWLISVQSSW